MDNSGGKDKERAKQEALATLGIYALERNNLESIMDRAIDVSCIILHLDCAVIFSLNEQGSTLEIGAQAGCAEDQDPIDINQENIDITYSIKQDSPTIVENYSEEKRFNISSFLENGNMESSIHLVVRGTEDTYGVLGFYSQQYRAFDDDEISFLQILANMVGMAIERDRMTQQLKKKNEKLNKEIHRSHEFQQEILDNSIMQRWELGSYLHDNLAQSLASAKINIYSIRKNIPEANNNANNDLDDLENIISNAINGVRDLTQDIIPIDIEEEGFIHALKTLMQKTRNIHDIGCFLEINGKLPKVVDINIATNLYFIIQEAIKNACVHGEAQKVWISFSKEQPNLRLEIKDDGIGYNHSSQKDKGKGLRIMSHRIELLGGTFDVEEYMESIHSGTKITCLIPIYSMSKKRKTVQW